jgi:hypothetical protein
MKQAVKMDSDAMIHVPSFMKIGSGIQKLTQRIHRHRQHGDLISLTFGLLSIFFFKIRKLKKGKVIPVTDRGGP